MSSLQAKTCQSSADLFQANRSEGLVPARATLPFAWPGITSGSVMAITRAAAGGYLDEVQLDSCSLQRHITVVSYNWSIAMSDEDFTIFPPAAVEKLAGVTTDSQRDLRHRGCLTGYGQQISNRWHYSAKDVIAFWISKRLMNTGFGRHQSCRIARSHVGDVLEYLKGTKDSISMVVLVHSAEEDEVSEGYWVVDDFSEIQLREFERADVINLQYLADQVPTVLRETIAEFKSA